MGDQRIGRRVDRLISRLRTGRGFGGGLLRRKGRRVSPDEAVATVMSTLRSIEAEQAQRNPLPTGTPGREFYRSQEWRALRYRVLVKRGGRCECCGATAQHGERIDVDHIKPRSLFPDLALEESNLQVLCETCNFGKGNSDATDWRRT